jgi:hypothetical protein
VEDLHNCPICNSKFRVTRNINYFIPFIKKSADYIEKKCVSQPGHSIAIYVDNQKIDYVKFSLAENFSTYIFLDFLNSKSKVSFYDNGSNTQSLDLDHLLIPDFPELKLLRNKISKYSAFL